MIKGRGTFPYPGSFALHDTGGETRLARILSHPDSRGIVTVSYPMIVSASGQTEVPFDRLQDGTPLSDAELEEYELLVIRIAGQTRPRRKCPKRDQYDADVARYEELRLRNGNSLLLDRLIDEAVRRKLLDRLNALAVAA
jgi:hypothetical protein